jgi:NAD-dependent SIR2 family protein deacetylase
MMKRCTACAEEKPESDFAKDKRRKDGLDSRCKKCGTSRTRKYQPLVHDQIQPRTKSISNTKRQNLIVKYGIAVVEAMEDSGGL